MKHFLSIMLLAILFSGSLNAQVRVAVLPFTNMHGDAKFNIWCYNLQDSLAQELQVVDPEEKLIQIVPMDSVESVLAEMNLDPANPQYASDLWLAVEKLNVEYVITGNFKVQAKRFLINAYIYDVVTKLPNVDHQVRDIFKKETCIYESVPIIANTLIKAFKPE